MPYIKSQNAAITADRNWLISKQYDSRWSPSERTRLKDIAKRYKVKWSGNTRRVPWNTLLERVDIIPGSMVATMAAAESGWGTSKLARNNNNLFGMKCVKGRCTNAPGKVKGYSQVNAQIQLNGNDDRWFARAWIQNVFDNNAVTGLYVTDQSSGLFTNIFTLEPRRYGITAGVKF